LIPAQGTALQPGKRVVALRRCIYAVPDHSDGADGVSLALSRFLIALIVVTLAATVIVSFGNGDGRDTDTAAGFG
jgi:hypothetical protein